MLRFRSKVDALLMVPAAVAFGVTLLLIARGLTDGRPLIGAAIPLVVLAIAVSMHLVSYEIAGDELIVRQGIIRRRMPLARITALKATRQMWSSPALALDRIEIRTDRGLWLMVSPADKAGFISAIRARVPAIAIEGFAPGTIE